MLQHYFVGKAFKKATESQDYAGYLVGSKIISVSLGLIIVLLNKLVCGKIVSGVAYLSKSHTKSELRGTYAAKLSVLCFLNAAIGIYLYYWIWNVNLVGTGGFVEVQSWLIIWNAILPLLMELIDLSSVLKKSQQEKALQDSYQNKSYLTQKQANQLMEFVEYNLGDSYSDAMQTLWLTVLFALVLPAATIFGALSLLGYYFINKYNLLSKRSVNETLCKTLSDHMVELTEYSLPLFSFGGLYFIHKITGEYDFMLIVLLIVGLGYLAIPFKEFIDTFFSKKSINSKQPYQVAERSFITNYDRENPFYQDASVNNLMNKFAAQNLLNQQLKYSNTIRKVEED